MPQIVSQTLVFGILVGALYSLVALGLSLVFDVTKLLNVAHGELVMLGGYTSFWACGLWGADPFATIPAAFVALLVAGMIVYLLLFVCMVKLPEETKIKNTLLVGFGLSVTLQNLALRLWTADHRGIRASYSNLALTVLGVRFPVVCLARLGTAFVFLFGLHLFLHKTYTGEAIRATVQDWEAATLMGINVQRVYLLAFPLGAALAGVAGTLVAANYSIEPAMGLTWTLKALIVMVLGGLGSITGTLVGGLLLGLTESVTSLLISNNYREVVSLILFLLILVIRPQGLFGVKEG